MIRAVFAAALAGCLVLSWPAHARGFDATRTLALCGDGGMFGYAFGTDRQAGGRIGLSSSRFVTPDAQYAPFTEAELVFTYRSQALHTVVGIATLGSEAEADSARVALISAAGGEARFVRREDGPLDAAFFTRDADDEGLRVEIGTMGRQLHFSCINAPLRALTFDELAGRDAGALQRPTPPLLSLPVAPAANVCQTPDGRTALLRNFDQSMESVLGYGQASLRYGEALATYKGRQMVQRGIWTEDERATFDTEAALDPMTMRAAMQGIRDVSAMMGALRDADTARRQGDDSAACAAAVSALSIASAVSVRNEAQWRAIAARYDAEARRRGAQPVE